MAKILITNNIVNPSLRDSGFEHEEVNGNDFTFLSFKKLNLKHHNFIQFENGDFVASAGTLIYKGVLGLESLRQAYFDFNSKNINNLRKDCFGNYTLAIRKNNRLSIFVDENGIHDLFYKTDGVHYSIGTSLYDITLLGCNPDSFNQEKLVQYSAQYCLIGGATFFDDIYKLQGDQVIELELTQLSFRVFKIPRESTRMDDKRESLDLISEMECTIDESIKLISKNFNDISISMTGGLDSRLLLAGFLKNNIKPKLVYGIGNSSITNTKDEDLRINRILADRYELELHIQDWSNPRPFDLNWGDLRKKYGFLSCIYGGGNIFKELESDRTSFIEYGYFGEPLRNVDWLETKKGATFTLEEFLTEFYLNKEVYEAFENPEIYLHSIKDTFLLVCEEYNLDPRAIELKDFQILHNAYRKNADSVMLNLTNLFCFSASILSQKKCTDISEKISKKEKDKARFMLRLLLKLFPDSLQVEIFSHTKKWVFDMENLELRKKWKMPSKLVDYIKKNLKKRVSFMESTYSKFLSKKNAQEINERETLRKFFRESTKLKNADEINHLSFLAKFAQNKYIIDAIYKNQKM